MKKSYSLAAALLVSLFIYVFYRTDKTAVNQLVIYFFSFELYTQLKAVVSSSLPLDGLIVYSLPGGLWIFCATVLANNFYFELDDHKIPIGPLPALFATTLEFCQLSHLTHGTFDAWDVIFYGVAWPLATWLFNDQRAKQNILSPLTFHGVMCLSCIFCVFLAHVSR